MTVDPQGMRTYQALAALVRTLTRRPDEPRGRVETEHGPRWVDEVAGTIGERAPAT